MGHAQLCSVEPLRHLRQGGIGSVHGGEPLMIDAAGGIDIRRAACSPPRCGPIRAPHPGGKAKPLMERMPAGHRRCQSLVGTVAGGSQSFSFGGEVAVAVCQRMPTMERVAQVSQCLPRRLRVGDVASWPPGCVDAGSPFSGEDGAANGLSSEWPLHLPAQRRSSRRQPASTAAARPSPNTR